ncbi:MAG: hypothetical protein IAE80_16905 [Anaerolinea sp.]|nr:hypothetical protein [Anaerolinea sp.]
MAEQKHVRLTRRDAIKIITAATAGTLLILPDKWAKPLLNIGALPAHAQTSVIRSLVCPANPPIAEVSGSLNILVSVQVTPPAAGISVGYSITTTTGTLLSPAANPGTAVTNGAGVATTDILLDTAGVSGSATVTWQLAGAGSCQTVYQFVDVGDF